MRKTVGVTPPEEKARRERLFSALGEAMGVDFEGRDSGSLEGLDAVVAFGEPDVPSPLPTLVLATEGLSGGDAGEIEFASSPALDAALRGRSLAEGSPSPRAAVAAEEADEVLAQAPEGPVWVARAGKRRLEVAGSAPSELTDGETIRDRLCPERFLGLLPLVHFLRRLTATGGWSLPGLRATFLFDDPNLHWPSYGYVRYRSLADHAERHGYHASMAMVPLDAWLADPRAARLFRERSRSLSLVVHGNDHVHRELARPRSAEAARALAAQALRRISAFERRTGVGVERVMVPPHGACSAETMRALLATGFDGLCTEWPYWWLEPPLAMRPVSGWEPAEFFVGGLPVLPRHWMSVPPDDLVFRALLGQPLIVAGHQEDIARGNDVLAETAAYVSALGEVEWMSVGAIARSNYATLREGATLRIRPFARAISVPVPPGVEEISLEPVSSHEELGAEAVFVVPDAGSPNGALRVELPSRLPVSSPATLDIRLRRTDAVDPEAVPRPPMRPWPIVRRLLSEGRDRVTPVLPGGRR